MKTLATTSGGGISIFATCRPDDHVKRRPNELPQILATALYLYRAETTLKPW